MPHTTGPSEVALVAEYQNGQRFVTFVGQVMWQGQAVLLSAALAGAAVALAVAPSLANVIAVSAFAVVVVGIVDIARRIWVRHLQTLEIAWTRLREIETILGLRLNTYLDALRHWPDRPYEEALDASEWSKLTEKYPKYTVARTSQFMSHIVARIIQIGWVMLAICKWIDYGVG